MLSTLKMKTDGVLKRRHIVRCLAGHHLSQRWLNWVKQNVIVDTYAGQLVVERQQQQQVQDQAEAAVHPDGFFVGIGRLLADAVCSLVGCNIYKRAHDRGLG